MNNLIVIEGLDGSGKSTQVELLREYLIENSYDIEQIKLPDYENPSSTLVKMYLKGDFGTNPQDVNAYAASTFYAVDRYASFNNKWKKHYESGTIILADRYTTSNAAHQMVKLKKEDWDEYLEWLEELEYKKIGIPKPSVVIYLDMPIEISQKLMTSRYKGNEKEKDVHECNVQYLKDCRVAALYAADKLGWKVIECSDGENPRSIKDINKQIVGVMEEILK